MLAWSNRPRSLPNHPKGCGGQRNSAGQRGRAKKRQKKCVGSVDRLPNHIFGGGRSPGGGNTACIFFIFALTQSNSYAITNEALPARSRVRKPIVLASPSAPSSAGCPSFSACRRPPPARCARRLQPRACGMGSSPAAAFYCAPRLRCARAYAAPTAPLRRRQARPPRPPRSRARRRAQAALQAQAAPPPPPPLLQPAAMACQLPPLVLR